MNLIRLRKAVLKSSSRSLRVAFAVGYNLCRSSQEEFHVVNEKKKGRQFGIMIRLIFSQRMQRRVTKALRNVVCACVGVVIKCGAGINPSTTFFCSSFPLFFSFLFFFHWRLFKNPDRNIDLHTAVCSKYRYHIDLSGGYPWMLLWPIWIHGALFNNV